MLCNLPLIEYTLNFLKINKIKNVFLFTKNGKRMREYL